MLKVYLAETRHDCNRLKVSTTQNTKTSNENISKHWQLEKKREHLDQIILITWVHRSMTPIEFKSLFGSKLFFLLYVHMYHLTDSTMKAWGLHLNLKCLPVLTSISIVLPDVLLHPASPLPYFYTSSLFPVFQLWQQQRSVPTQTLQHVSMKSVQTDRFPHVKAVFVHVLQNQLVVSKVTVTSI